MGKISVEGKAKRLVSFDTLTTTITFNGMSEHPSRSIGSSLDDTDEFLEIIKERGLPISIFEAGENNVEHYRYNNYKDLMTKRTIVSRTPYDLDYMSMIMRIMEDKGYDVDTSFSPGISNYSEIETELYKEAARDAERRAKEIAHSLGMEVKSLFRMTDREDYSNEYVMDGPVEMDGVLCDSGAGAPDRSYSEIEPGKTEITVKVGTEWIVE